MYSVVQSEGGNKAYESSISVITTLLQLALDLGRLGLLQSDCGVLVKAIDEMSGAYGCALNRSLRVSLTVRHCAAIDEKSHEIEALRLALEKRLESARSEIRFHEVRVRAGNTARPKNQKVSALLHRCRQVRRCTRTMMEENAALMRR